MNDMLRLCADDDAVRCQNCDWNGVGAALGTILDFEQRVHAGEITPAGECPKCGALAIIEPIEVEPAPLTESLYRVTVRQDAYINHVTLVRAESPAHAVERALDGWNGDESIKFVDEGATGFDDAYCDSEDDVELIEAEQEADEEADFAKVLAGETSKPKVWLATYEHKHGREVRIFSTESKAIAWRIGIAIEEVEVE